MWPEKSQKRCMKLDIVKISHAHKNTFLMGHNSQERNSVANKPTQLVCPVFLRFTVFPCLIARTI